MMIESANNAPRRRAKEEKREARQNVADLQELVLSLSEENAALKEANEGMAQEISDLQELVLQKTEEGEEA